MTSHTPQEPTTKAKREASLSGDTTPPLRRLHPLTPVLGSWRLLGGLTAAAFGLFRDDFEKLMWIWDALHGDTDVGVLLKAVGVVAAALLISAFGAWLSWRATGFAILPDAAVAGTLLYHRGFLVRQRSQVRLKRVQSVDVNQPLVPRLLGLSALRLDMAAGEGASVNLAYLRVTEAWKLREEILRHTGVASEQTVTQQRAAQPGSGELHQGGRVAAELGPGTGPAAHTPQADQLIAQVSTAHLIRANLLDGVSAWLLLVAWFVALVVGTVVWGWEAVLAGFAFLVPVTIGVVAQTSRQIGSMMKDANFRLYRTPTGVRISSGLTSTINRTIDFDRIQSVRVMEPFLWRRFGWAGVLVDIAGGPLDAEKAAALMPVAGRAAALHLVTQVTGVSLDHGAYVGAGARARSVDPIAWRHLAVALFDEGAARRSGRWRRSTAFVPYKRVQSVTARQGWLQRRLALATVFVDLPVGAKRWDAQHRSVKDATILVHELSHRASALAGLEPASQSAGGRDDQETEEQASQQLASGVEHRP